MPTQPRYVLSEFFSKVSVEVETFLRFLKSPYGAVSDCQRRLGKENACLNPPISSALTLCKTNILIGGRIFGSFRKRRHAAPRRRHKRCPPARDGTTLAELHTNFQLVSLPRRGGSRARCKINIDLRIWGPPVVLVSLVPSRNDMQCNCKTFNEK